MARTLSQRYVCNVHSHEPVEAAALRFVDSLTPGRFETARAWLADTCEYVYGDTVLTGAAIVQSFVDNHARASRQLDTIEYQEGLVESVEGRTVSVLVTDRIGIGSRTHDYRDRLVVTFGSHTGTGSVVRIENRRVEGEREKLVRFLATCGIEWA